MGKEQIFLQGQVIVQNDKYVLQEHGEFLSLLKDLTSSDESIISSLNELIGKMEG